MSDTAIYFALIAFHVGTKSTSSVLHNNILTTSNATSGVLHQQLLYHAAPHLYIRLCVGICRGAEKCGCAALVSLGDARANAKRWTIDLEDSSTVIIDSHRDCNYGNCTSSLRGAFRRPRSSQAATATLAEPLQRCMAVQDANVTQLFESDPRPMFLRYQLPTSQAKSGDPCHGQPGP